MKWLLGSSLVLAIGMIVPAIADNDAGFKVAQNPDQDRGRGGGGRGGQNGPPGPGGRGAQPTPNPGPPQAGPGRGNGPQGPGRGGPVAGGRAGNGGPAPGNRGAVNAPQYHGPPMVEKRAFQRNYVSTHRFHANVYRRPPGWAYQRWGFGQILPPAYWARTYWLANYRLYGLDRPPLGCEWVRFGPDSLLVDTSTGEVLEAVYNLFY